LTAETCPSGLEAKSPGSHFTWIKAEKLDLKGLRLAIGDASESLLRGRNGVSNPNDVIHSYIGRIRISHQGHTETFNFSPWMNCVIGGRGVGKSTILELIRLTMGRTADLLDSALKADLERFIPNGERSGRWWEESTSIEIHYTKDGRPLRLLWNGAEPKETRIEAWNGLEWQAQSGRASDRAPIQIFSQKQIYELARNPQNFLALLDRMEAIERSGWDEEYNTLESRFRDARERLRRLLTETDRADRLKGELQEVQGRLRHLATLRADSRYQELETLEANLRGTLLTDESVAAVVETLTEQARTLRALAGNHTELTGYQTRTIVFEEASAPSRQMLTVKRRSASPRNFSPLTTSRSVWPIRSERLPAFCLR
jgi:DNA repair ATPase RecN